MLKTVQLEIQEVIFKGPRFTLYKALVNKVIYALKVADENKQAELLLKNEYFINKILNHIKGVRKVYDLFHYQEVSLALLLEYIPYGSLKEFIRSEGKLDIKSFLEIAIPVTETIAAIHKNNVIHKDINPTNILVDKNSKKTKVIDFSISEIFSATTSEVHKGLFVGTYEYVAPEQTGRLNEIVDFRADLYSLGATFYYMLTGSPPFKEKNKELLIYYHLTKKPEPVNKINPEVPNVIAKIIAKLLEKRPENRYQSALPLLEDLQKAYNELQEKGTISDFEIAENDIPTTLIFSTKNYGYQDEEKILVNALEEVYQNKTPKKWIHINSHLDYGAKTFVRRLQKKALEKRGVFVEAALQPGEQAPLSAMVKILNNLFDKYLIDNQSLLSKIEQTILVPNKSLMPYLKLQLPFLNRYFPVLTNKNVNVKAIPHNTQQELLKLYENIIKIITDEFPIFIVAIYNIEFADKFSIKFIRKIIRHKDLKNLMWVTVNFYQQSNPNLSQLLEFTKEHYPNLLIELTLPGHDFKEIIEFVKDTFKVSEVEAEKLAHLLVARYGKGFANIKRAIKELYNSGAIYYSPEKKKWQFDYDKIKQQEESTDIPSFYERKLASLPEASITILKIAAALGIIFNVGELYNILGISFHSFKEHFGYLIKAGLIEVSVQYWDEITEEDLEDISASFTSITLAEKILNELPEIEKKRYYHKIATYLLKNLPQEKLQKRTYEIVKYITKARDLFSFDRKVLEFLLESAFIASSEGENEVAYNAITSLIYIGKNNLWEKLPNIAANAYLLYAKVAIETGKIEEFYKVLKILTARKASNIEIAGLLLVGIQRLTEQEDFNSLEKIAKNIIPELFKEYIDSPDKYQNINKALSELKLRFFTSNILGGLKSIFSIKKKRGKNPMEELAIANIEKLLELPNVKNQEIAILMKILSRAILPFYASNIYLSVWALNQLIKLSLKYGNSSASVVGYVGFGAFLTSALDEDIFPAYFIWQVSEELMKRYPNQKSEYILMKIFALFYISPWFDNITKHLPEISRLYNEAINENEFFYAGYIATLDIMHNLLSTTSLSNLETICIYYQTQLDEVGIKQFKGILSFYKDWILSMKDPAYQGNLDDELPNNFIGYLMAFANQLKFMLKGIPNYSLKWANKCKELEKYSLGSVAFIFSKYLYAITLLETGALSPEQKEDLKNILAFLKRGGEYSKELQVKYKILEGLKLVYERKNEEAYDMLINLFQEEQETMLPINKLILMEKLLGIALVLNKEADAITFIYKLIDMYKNSELYYKLEEIATKYSELAPDVKLLLEDIKAPKMESGTQSTTFTATTSYEKSISNILQKLSKQISKGVNNEKIIIHLMREALLHTGMHKIVLVKKHKDDLFVTLDMQTETLHNIENLQNVPILKYKDKLPVSIISYVEQLKKTLILSENSPQYKSFSSDNYIKKVRPTTMLLFPLTYGEELLGILYCEFTDREADINEFEVLITFISSYLAMSLHFIKKMDEEKEKSSAEIKQLQNFINELKQHNHMLSERLRELENELYELNESLKYAARIQQAVLKSPEQLKEALPKSFVLWKPHSVVSGDFFYFSKNSNEYIVVAADATGHGIAASQLTILGTVFLHKIIEDNNIKEPAKILSLLDKYMLDALSKAQDLTTIKEGMDVAVIYVNTQTKIMKYAGANAPMVYTDGEKLLGLSPTKMPIGNYDVYGNNKTFKEKEINLTPQTKLYLFSDGYKDQVGGAEARKLGKKLFYKIIYTISQLPWEIQGKKLEEALNKWKGEHPQTDDILVIGLQALQ